MKYFSLVEIQEALRFLRPHHAIFATTFFVMKKERAPVGSTKHFQLDAANHEFLNEHYRVHPKSQWFFRVMRQGQPGKDWNRPKYASGGLQSVNTRGRTKPFLHDRNEDTWGWSGNYVQELAKVLPNDQKVPLYHVAVWLYREHGWLDGVNRGEVIKEIIRDFYLTSNELSVLFDTEVKSELSEEETFQPVPVKWHQILEGFSIPPDVPPENSGVLTSLETVGLGPVRYLKFEPGRRLNIVTGDNGLGKTFLLDLCWWALTRNWAEREAQPFRLRGQGETSIKYVVAGREAGRPVRAKYNRNLNKWEISSKLTALSGLVIYARVDGSFAIWDPANQLLSQSSPAEALHSITFTREEVWSGKDGKIEGLLRDWVRWQDRADKYPAFHTFQAILKRVSPPDMGELKIGEPTRIPGEVRPIPTLEHPFGRVPLVFESAGIKRIVTLAYLIVWAWEEHKVQSKQAGKKEERQMVVIIDEAEAHLHPKWQRVLLPALLGIGSDLHAEMALQLLIATHSPLVLASSEPIFDFSLDKLYHLDMSDKGDVTFDELQFEFRGSVDSWLSSQVFRIGHPGSSEREDAIKEAIRIQESEKVRKEEVEKVSEKLKRFLAPEDPFWVRWLFFAEQHDVHL